MEYLYKNCFTQDEINFLYLDIIKNSEDGQIFKESGRKIIFLKNLQNNIIIKKIEHMVGNKYNKRLKVGTAAYHIYSLKYGIPECKPHIDDYIGEFVFDYQLDANIDWKLKINKNEYSLSNNDAVSFMGESVPHGRKNIYFQKNDHVIMLIVNLVSEEHWSNFSKKNPVSKEIIMEKIKKIRDDKDNW